MTKTDTDDPGTRPLRVQQAILLARSVRYGPLAKQEDPYPTAKEALEILTTARSTCGFNWITATEAINLLRQENAEAI